MPNTIKKVNLDLNDKNSKGQFNALKNNTKVVSSILKVPVDLALESTILSLEKNSDKLEYKIEDFDDAYKYSNKSYLENEGVECPTEIISDIYYDGDKKRNNLDKCFEIFNESIKKSKYGNLENFNKYIKDSVNKAGVGSVGGIIAAAMALCYDYPKETGKRFFYTNDFSTTMRTPTDGIVAGQTNLDCRAFVQWIVHNGGFKSDILEYRASDSGNVSFTDENGVEHICFEQWGQKNGLVKNDINSAKPGDIFSGGASGGHIWMVAGNFDGGYYVAEENGYNGGAVINKYTFEEMAQTVEHYDAKLYDMQGYYSDPNNIRDDLKTK